MRSRVILPLAGILLFPAVARSFEIDIHRQVTTEGLSTVQWEFPDGTMRTFPEEQAKSLSLDVGAVDYAGLGLVAANPGNHFDNDHLETTSKNIKQWTDHAIDCLTASSDLYYGDPASRLEGCWHTDDPLWEVAMAVHAIQDFYSHSSFVSLPGRGTTLKDTYKKQLGIDTLEDPKTDIAHPLKNDSFCEVANPGQPLASVPVYADGKRKLTTGYFDTNEALACGLTKFLFGSCDSDSACCCLGSNGDYPITVCGSCYPCKPSPALPGGAYNPAGKCQHGFGRPEENYCGTCLGLPAGESLGPIYKGCNGINKDRQPVPSSPESCIAAFDHWHHHDEHLAAKNAAILATTQYFNDVVIPNITKKNSVGICRLFGLDDSDCLGTCPIPGSRSREGSDCLPPTETPTDTPTAVSTPAETPSDTPIQHATPTPTAAHSVVGNGSPASCTEAALDAALAAGGSVTFDCGPDPVTITVTSQKTVTNHTSIDGGNLVALSSGVSTSVLGIDAGATATIMNLAITSADMAQNGAGGIYNAGTLNAINCIFFGIRNMSNGAIANSGTFSASNCTFSGNRADGSGGAIDNYGTVNLANSTFSGNSAGGVGGAIYNAGMLTVTGNTFSNNMSGAEGGAIDNYATMDVTNSTFSSNRSMGTGGAINSWGTTAVTSTNFAENRADSGSGNAISVLLGTVILTNTTIHSSAAGGNCRTGGSGIFIDGGQNVASDGTCGFAPAAGPSA